MGENGQTIDCLLKHMHDDDMNMGCAKELEKEQEKRTKSVLFNPAIAINCQDDLKRLRELHKRADKKCQEPASVAEDTLAMECLTEYRNDIKKRSCQKAVRDLLTRQHNDLRAKPEAVDFCKDDIT